jgi:hypothetical protein
MESEYCLNSGINVAIQFKQSFNIIQIKKQIQIQRKKSSFHCFGQITIQENMGLADNNWQ